MEDQATDTSPRSVTRRHYPRQEGLRDALFSKGLRVCTHSENTCPPGRERQSLVSTPTPPGNSHPNPQEAVRLHSPRDRGSRINQQVCGNRQETNQQLPLRSGLSPASPHAGPSRADPARLKCGDISGRADAEAKDAEPRRVPILPPGTRYVHWAVHSKWTFTRELQSHCSWALAPARPQRGPATPSSGGLAMPVSSVIRT